MGSTRETWFILWFRYVVPYIQFEAYLSFVRMLSYKDADVSYGLDKVELF
jgi:hypothetical protein